MAHMIKDDDSNIIKKCRAHGFCCTYDTKRDFEYKSVTDAIAAVLASRAKQSEKLNQLITRTDEILDPLQKLIDNAGRLTQLSGNGMSLETSRQDVIESYLAQLIKEKSCLDAGLNTLKDVRRVMDRKHIRVPVIGVINSGKSTFLHSALGGGMSDKVKGNLFPSAGAHMSCTGTRTVLIYDKDSKDVEVVAKFKDKAAFLNDCKQSVSRMAGVLEKLEVSNRFPEIYRLQDAFTDGADPIALLNRYYQSVEFHNLCNMRYKDEWDAESVHDFCSLVHFSKDQDYSEDRKDFGTPKTTFSVSGLIKAWNEGTSYSLQIPSDHEFRAVRNFVCKYDPDMGQGAK